MRTEPTRVLEHLPVRSYVVPEVTLQVGNITINDIKMTMK